MLVGGAAGEELFGLGDVGEDVVDVDFLEGAFGDLVLVEVVLVPKAAVHVEMQLLDLGAYAGDTLARLFDLKLLLVQVLCFVPQSTLLSALRQYNASLLGVSKSRSILANVSNVVHTERRHRFFLRSSGTSSSRTDSETTMYSGLDGVSS